ncbi:MAG: response regulator receiver protein [Micrococcaceae bacterium]|jgi:GAF domain-containing protein|nr:response regulator receiver protein [Micrococcaceae bacterium]
MSTPDKARSRPTTDQADNHGFPIAADDAGSVSVGAGSISDELQDLVLDSPDIAVFLKEISERAAAVFSAPGADIHCAVLLVRPRMQSTMTGSSPEAIAMDEIQTRYDDGPCLRAARYQEPCVVEDFRSDTRFGQYTTSILHTGIRSALGVPIQLDGAAAAALDLYSTRPGEFDSNSVQDALGLAGEASRALRTAVRIAHFSDAAKNLRLAMDSRATIQIATGIIMGQSRCSHDAAMTILRSASSSRNTKLSDIAASVLLSIGQEPPTAHFDY